MSLFYCCFMFQGVLILYFPYEISLLTKEKTSFYLFIYLHHFFFISCHLSSVFIDLNLTLKLFQLNLYQTMYVTNFSCYVIGQFFFTNYGVYVFHLHFFLSCCIWCRHSCVHHDWIFIFIPFIVCSDIMLSCTSKEIRCSFTFIIVL